MGQGPRPILRSSWPMTGSREAVHDPSAHSLPSVPRGEGTETSLVMVTAFTMENLFPGVSCVDGKGLDERRYQV